MRAERFEVGAHTLNRPDLTTLAPASKKWQIAGSKAWREDITGEPVTMFCYVPQVRRGDERRSVGWSFAARTIRQFSVTPPSDHFVLRTTLQAHPHQLPRHTPHESTYHFSLTGRLAPFFPPWLARSGYGRNWGHVADLLPAAGERDVFHPRGHSWEIEEKVMRREGDAFLRWISGLGSGLRRNAKSAKAAVLTTGPIACRSRW